MERTNTICFYWKRHAWCVWQQNKNVYIYRYGLCSRIACVCRSLFLLLSYSRFANTFISNRNHIVFITQFGLNATNKIECATRNETIHNFSCENIALRMRWWCSCTWPWHEITSWWCHSLISMFVSAFMSIAVDPHTHASARRMHKQINGFQTHCQLLK